MVCMYIQHVGCSLQAEPLQIQRQLLATASLVCGWTASGLSVF